MPDDLAFFEDPEATIEEVEEVAEVETVEEVQEPEQEVKAEEPKEEATTAPKEDETEQAWTKAMALDERRKRQEAQKELDGLKAQLEEKAKVDTPDVFEDQEAFTNHLRSEFDQKLINQRVELSRDILKDQHEDYEAMEQAFIELAGNTPGLREQVLQQSNPAKFVYEQGKKHTQFKEMQDVDSYKNKMRAEIKAELEAEMSSKSAEKSKVAASITPSLANARSSDSSIGEVNSFDSLYNT
jgi:hypothetical protein